MITKLTLIIFGVAATIAAMIASIPPRMIAAPKAEDDFQLMKVADGVYAAIAKSGGLAC